jgi:hypothetical protein
MGPEEPWNGDQQPSIIALMIHAPHKAGGLCP